ncbi:MAG: type II toxin-antitoxin system VapC family toxin [Candidatus Njordarchaeia archaeon]
MGETSSREQGFEMSYLIDASALLPLLKRYGERIAFWRHKLFILDLTIYEVGNAIWKDLYLIKRGKIKTNLGGVRELIEAVIEILAQLNVLSINLEDFDRIIEESTNLGLTFYDSAYVYYAEKNNLTLITEDREILKKYGKAITTKDVK